MGRTRALAVAAALAVAGTVVGSGPVAPTAPVGAVVDPTPTVDPTNRASVWAAYQSSLVEPKQVGAGWTGNTAGCVEGTESAASVEATRAAINFFRVLSGLPAATIDTAASTDAMRAALLMQANLGKGLSHTPSSDWACWTQARSDAAGTHNLASIRGAGGVELYAVEPGVGNDWAGHRRHLLNPRATSFAVASTDNRNAMSVETTGPLPAGVDWITYPNAGFVPKATLRPYAPSWEKVLFSLTNAQQAYDYSAATATVKVGATSLPVEVQAPLGSYMTWYVTLPSTWDTSGDVKLDVTVSGIRTSAGAAVPDRSWSTTAITSGAAATVPGSPTAVTATRGDGQATVSWTAPTATGGSPITGYRITPYVGGTAQTTRTSSGTATTQVVTGLANGTAHTFRVQAVNAVGAGVLSAASAAVTPAGVPGAPTGVTAAAAGATSATVGWPAPAATGGAAITGYRVTPYVGAAAQAVRTFTTPAATQTVTGLSSGTTYTFRVQAVNEVGTGTASTASNSVVTTSTATVPGAPTNVTAVAGDGRAAVTWTAPSSNGGSPITGYRITPHRGGTALAPITTSGTGTSRTVTGLTNGAAHTFRVQALNAVGASALSAASSAVTPAGPPYSPYASWTDLVDQIHRQLIGRTATTAERNRWLTPLQTGTQSPGDLVAELRQASLQRTIVDPVTRLYQAYYLRMPDRDGLEYWIAKRQGGQSLVSISAFFARSSEFTTLYGSRTDQQFVELIYQNILGRPGEADGVTYWTGEITSGRRSRGQVMLGFSESAEYRDAQASAVTVAVLYLMWADRSPTPDERTAGIAALEGGQSVAAFAQSLLPKAAVLRP